MVTWLQASTAETLCLPVSLIVPSRNRPAQLLETVQAVLRGDCLPAELIVTDQSDEPDPYLQSYLDFGGCQFRYIHSTRPGVSAARNLGARMAAHDLLLFLDDDLTVDAPWLLAMTEALSGEGPGVVVTGQVQEIAGDLDAFAPSCTTEAGRVRYKGRIGRDVLYSGNMAIHRSDFEAVGGFDERLGPGRSFPAAEDNDLGLRLLAAGCEIEYVPEALAWHRAWRSEGDVIRLQGHYGRGQGAFYGKHLRSAPGYIAHRLARDVTRPVRTLPERLRSRRLRRLLGDLAYAANVLWGAAQWLREQR